jgi:predicted acyltransferase
MSTNYPVVPSAKAGRILSLDVMRGIVIAFMILVNDSGSEQFAYHQLRHSPWNGWTLTDLVFPSFLLMVGVTSVFSAEARLAKGATRRELLLHTLQRALILFCLGVVVNGFPNFPLHTLRIYGVLQRIAVCYFAVSAIYLFSRRAVTFICITVGALAGYYILMRWIPVPGFGVPTHDIPLLDPDRNWVAFADRAIFPHRLYERVRDPEGLLSTLPALGTACLGVLTALWLRTQRSATWKCGGLLLGAAVGIASGELWNLWFPINKKLWTSSYVLFAAGCTLFLLALCYVVLDVKQWRGRWSTPMLIFGSNAITAYMVSELLATVLTMFHVHCGGALMTVQQCLYLGFFKHIVDPSFGSLVYSLVYVAVCMIPNVVLYRNRIFLKV